MKPRKSLCLVLLCICQSIQSAASADLVIVQEHIRMELESRVLGERRVINVFVPREVAQNPGARVPTLYMPDGGIEEDFIHVSNTIQQAVGAGEAAPLILVGIQNTERRRDMTGPTTVASDLAIAPRVGGSAPFRSFIREELIPEIERRFPVNNRRGVIGESLAGLFIVETLVEEPDLFSTYIALSPSLWWNNASLVEGLALARCGNRPARVFLAAADEENIAPHVAAVADACNGDRSGRWTILNRPDLDHSTIYRALAPQVIRSMYPKSVIDGYEQQPAH